MNIHDLLLYDCFHKKEHSWIKRLKPICPHVHLLIQGSPRPNFTIFTVQCSGPLFGPVPILIVWPYTNPLVSFYWVKLLKVEAWWKEEGSGWYLYGAKALSPKLKMECSNETRYRKPSFMNGVKQFCRYQYFCQEKLFYAVSSHSLFVFWFLKLKVLTSKRKLGGFVQRYSLQFSYLILLINSVHCSVRPAEPKT